MKVAMVVSEMEPFAKTGGLADVAGSLPLALAALGLEVHVFMPRYACIKESADQTTLAHGVTVHFIRHEGYFQRPELYGGADGDYPDNLERFSFFCRQVFVAMKSAGIRPDILHAHDWQAALSVVYCAKQFRQDPVFSKTRSALTVHNLGYQGVFPKEEYPKLGLPWELFSMDGFEFYDKVNLLKGGLLHADALTTVSPTYAKEIQAPEGGAGLDGVLRARSRELVGILNGLDQQSWNPATDQELPFHYDEKRLKEKSKNKTALQEELGLPVSPKTMLVGMVTRLAAQKGVDLVIEALPKLLKLDLQLVILGVGDRAIQEQLHQAAKKQAGVRAHIGFNEPLARRIYAGADAFLMPSRYEPCGLGQMIAMRYGAVPIVRATGGLADTVLDVRTHDRTGTGFCFRSSDPTSLTGAVHRAVEVFKEPRRWENLQRRCIKSDFSWDRSAQEYTKLYERLVNRL